MMITEESNKSNQGKREHEMKELSDKKGRGSSLSQMALFGLVVLIGLSGCRSTPKGRIKEESEGDLVGARSAGAPTFNKLVSGSTEKLLDRASAKYASPRLSVAVMEIENRSNEAIGDFLAQLDDVIETVFENSGSYDSVSRRYIEAVLRETRLKPDQLVIPKYARQFASVLERQDVPVTHLLFPRITSGTTRGDEVTQKDYLMSLELLDISSGRFDKETQRVRKEYN